MQAARQTNDGLTDGHTRSKHGLCYFGWLAIVTTTLRLRVRVYRLLFPVHTLCYVAAAGVNAL